MFKQVSVNIFRKTVRLLSSKTRGNYNKLSSNDVENFKSILSEPSMILTNEDDLKSYNVDWLGIYEGNSSLVLRPKSTQQVQQILQYCNQRRLALVPQGGNTGLVGGSVAVFDELVLSTQLMNQVVSFDPSTGVLVCEAGCVLESLNDHMKPHHFMMPLDLGAKGSCHIGGNVSTNAGGIRLLRYGSLQACVLGVEAVTGAGTLVDLLSSNRKDNTGYHLKHLFIGSEGTLGVVTRVSILCPIIPASVNLAFFSCKSFNDVLKMLKMAKENLGEILSAFEMMDSDSLNCAEEHLQTNVPIQRSEFYVVVETSGSLAEHDEDKVRRFFEEVEDTIVDGTLALDVSKMQNLWKFRETIPVGLVKQGYLYKYDVSLPLSHYYQVVPAMRQLLGPDVKTVCGYGHVGDGNLHFNVVGHAYDKDLEKKIDEGLYGYVVANGGSISAEHGVGVGKRDHLHLARSPESLGLMKSVKDLMDPNHILNPYKVLPL